MTHDELVRFAAGKVQVKVVPVFKEHYFPQIYDPDDTACSSDPYVKSRMIEGYVVEGTNERFDLTSPDLFLKGLEVCPYEVTINKDRVRNGVSNLPNTIELWSPGMGAEKSVRQIADIPPTFWQGWAELEGGQG